MGEGRKSRVALLVGAGDAIGAAVARRFAAGGYSICVVRRDAEKSRSVVQEIIASGGAAHAVSTDLRSEEAVQALFAQTEAELGPVEVCLFNAGANVKSPLIETSGRLFFKAWELACYGGFLTGREAARTWCRAAAARSYLPAPPPAFAAAPALPRLGRRSSACARWHSPWRASSHLRMFMLPI